MLCSNVPIVAGKDIHRSPHCAPFDSIRVAAKELAFKAVDKHCFEQKLDVQICTRLLQQQSARAPSAESSARKARYL